MGFTGDRYMMSNSSAGRITQKFLLALTTACLAGALFAGSASARAVVWSGVAMYSGETLTPVPQTLHLSVTNGKVRVKSLQVIMACTGDISSSEIAFWVTNGPTVSLVRNRFRFPNTFTVVNGGRRGVVRLSGILRSNGIGTALAQVSTETRNDGGGVENCAARVNFGRIIRGPS